MSRLDKFVFALDDELRKTRYFQEVTEEGIREGIEEGMQKPVSKLLNFGLSAEQIAEVFNLSVEQVRQIAARSPN